MDRPSFGSRNRVLDELLCVLVKTWGYTTVLQRLNRLQQKDDQIRIFSGTDKQERKRNHRRSAREYVGRMELPTEKRDVLLELAFRFENRNFLPTVGDVRSFLERKNVYFNPMRARDVAIPKIFDILLDMPNEKLQTILNDENYSGPSRLGPLSDAIKARSAAIRSAGGPMDQADRSKRR